MTGLHGHLMPALRMLPPEAAHRLAISALKLGLGPRDRAPDPPVLATTVWGLHFRNPVGLAAGFDKRAEVADAMMAAGFGFAEAGTVTPLPQSGNARPRLFRLSADRAVINRFGFNSAGVDAFVRRISRRRPGLGPLGANIGRNRASANEAADYETCIAAIAPHVDFIVINVSSPNTPGLRDMQRPDALSRLFRSARDARDRTAPERPPPLIVKVSPDLAGGELDTLTEVTLDAGIDGMTVVNTTTARPDHMTDPRRNEPGGLSGAPLFPMALEAIGAVYRKSGGRLPIVGSGGVSTGSGAYRLIRAGASLVQFYTAMIFSGPGAIREIRSGLATCLERDGFASVAEAVGADVTDRPPPRRQPARPARVADAAAPVPAAARSAAAPDPGPRSV